MPSEPNEPNQLMPRGAFPSVNAFLRACATDGVPADNGPEAAPGELAGSGMALAEGFIRPDLRHPAVPVDAWWLQRQAEGRAARLAEMAGVQQLPDLRVGGRVLDPTQVVWAGLLRQRGDGGQAPVEL